MPPCSALGVEALGVAARSGLQLLRDISFQVAPGTRAAVVGPNGAGKTTLLRTIAGTLRSGTGSVTLAGAPLERLPPMERARSVAVVAQGEAPDPRFSVRDYVSLGRLPHRGCSNARTDAAIVDDAMGRCGVRPFSARLFGSLSGGEQQRAILARALAQQPRLLIADEPTSHLDLRSRVEILGLMRDAGVTVLAVLHDLALVPDFADKVLLLQEGRLVGDGPPTKVLTPAVVRTAFGLRLLETAATDGTRHLVFAAL